MTDWIDQLIGKAKGPKRREWGTIGELEILLDSDGTVVLCKGYRKHGPSLEHPWLELTRDELRAFLARGDELLRAGRRSSRGIASGALHIRRPRFLLRVGDEAFPFLRNVERSEATARLADYVEEARSGPIVVTMRGRPVAFLAAVKGGDLEDCRSPPIPDSSESSGVRARAKKAAAVRRWRAYRVNLPIRGRRTDVGEVFDD